MKRAEFVRKLNTELDACTPDVFDKVCNSPIASETDMLFCFSEKQHSGAPSKTTFGTAAVYSKKEGELFEKLNQEFDQRLPDVFEAAKAQPIAVSAPSPYVKHRLKGSAIIAMVTAFVLIIAVLVALPVIVPEKEMPFEYYTSYVSLSFKEAPASAVASSEDVPVLPINDFNVSFVVNKDEIVTFILCSEGARLMLAGEELVGLQIDNAVIRVAELSVQMGYISPSVVKRALVVAAAAEDNKTAGSVRAKTQEKIENYFFENGVEAVVLEGSYDVERLVADAKRINPETPDDVPLHKVGALLRQGTNEIYFTNEEIAEAYENGIDAMKGLFSREIFKAVTALTEEFIEKCYPGSPDRTKEVKSAYALCRIQAIFETYLNAIGDKNTPVYLGSKEIGGVGKDGNQIVITLWDALSYLDHYENSILTALTDLDVYASDTEKEIIERFSSKCKDIFLTAISRFPEKEAVTYSRLVMILDGIEFDIEKHLSAMIAADNFDEIKKYVESEFAKVISKFNDKLEAQNDYGFSLSMADLPDKKRDAYLADLLSMYEVSFTCEKNKAIAKAASFNESTEPAKWSSKDEYIEWSNQNKQLFV